MKCFIWFFIVVVMINLNIGECAANNQKPPVKCQAIVAADGSGNFTSIQAAIDAAPSNSATRYIIGIKNGIYQEIIKVPSFKSNISLIGESAAGTKISYSRYAGEMNPASGKAYGTSGSTIVLISGAGFTAENITFENSFDEKSVQTAGTQAVAVKTDADKLIFKNCRFIGNQDTLYVNNFRQYFKDCYIEGDVDFIFSAATVIFDNCVIHSVDREGITPKGYVTAGSADARALYGLVFLNCKLTADPGVGANSVYLGRPWVPSSAKKPVYVKSVLIGCELGEHIKTEGWTSMSSAQPQDHFLREYQNTGAGANTTDPLRKQLTKEEAAGYNIKNIFKSFIEINDNWDPTIPAY